MDKMTAEERDPALEDYLNHLRTCPVCSKGSRSPVFGLHVGCDECVRLFQEMTGSWEAVVYAARDCPVLHAAVYQANHGPMTRERALGWAAVVLSQQVRTLLKAEADRLARLPARPGR